MKTTDYIIVAAEVGSPRKLSENIKARLAEGYEPYGSPMVVAVNPTSTQLFQAMVKREVTEEDVIRDLAMHASAA